MARAGVGGGACLCRSGPGRQEPSRLRRACPGAL